MSDENKGLTWGPIPSRPLTRIAFYLKIVKYRNGSKAPKSSGEYSLASFRQPALQLATSIFLSWLMLNIFADFGPMKYGASNGIRYSHDDWALQGSSPIQLIILGLAIVFSSFLKFCFFIAIFKKKVLTLGTGILPLAASVVALIWLVVWGDSTFVTKQYVLFIESSLAFSLSLVIVSSILFLGLDNFRTIKVVEA